MNRIVQETHDCDHSWTENIALKINMQQALEKLTPKERMVVSLRFDKQLKIEEISECLEMPLGTVKKCLPRALNKLRQELQLLEMEP